MSVLGPDGQPIGTQPDEPPLGEIVVGQSEVQGLMWGVSFLMMGNGMIGMCLLDPADVTLLDVEVGAEGGTVQWLAMRGRPSGEDGSHAMYGPNWEALPSLAAKVLAEKIAEYERIRLEGSPE